MLVFQAQYQSGIRLSIADFTDPEAAVIPYGHLQLVKVVRQEPVSTSDEKKPIAAGDPVTIKQISIHAGGIEADGNLLFVVDTHVGIRIFDLNNLFTADSSIDDRIGTSADGKLVAFSHRYVIPEIGVYQFDHGDPFSSISLQSSEQETGSDKVFITSQYVTKWELSPSPLVHGFHFINGAFTSAKPDRYWPADTPSPTLKLKRPVYYSQGAMRINGVIWSTITGQTDYKNSTARLVRTKSVDLNNLSEPNGSATRFRWPHGSEDLYYERATDMLWSLTEHPRSSKLLEKCQDRVVFGVELSTYDDL
ncbi:MAG: hypothetical protein A2284_18615 [Deltaproteobacteria bacterium RIFOXYA12_FULL_61_11]|nr:MAG: hypothetical protein A2284_18615 [Deltaproteobacteria bacterium RIFOXYA12_FULL_61_11]